ncbi:hypothetical protein vBVpaMR16F_25 [Vibrio phage vB_VpaM_R16F]|nr:hypothetical protein vBVpaMR16F_25 [Vibrio phage vB_VpaM_R16F]
MKLKCGKCNKPLTTDLRPVKVRWKYNPLMKSYYVSNPKAVFTYKTEVFETMEGEHQEDVIMIDRMKKGIFYLTKPLKYNWTPEDCGIEKYYRVHNEKQKIVVSELSLVKDVVPPFKQGYGCCNYSMGEPLKCNCGSLLGEMYLDCYETGQVMFDIKKVIRDYQL